MARASIILSTFPHLAGREKNGEMMHEHSAYIYGMRIVLNQYFIKKSSINVLCVYVFSSFALILSMLSLYVLKEKCGLSTILYIDHLYRYIFRIFHIIESVILIKCKISKLLLKNKIIKNIFLSTSHKNFLNVYLVDKIILK